MYKYHKDGLKPSNGEIFVFGSNLAGRHGAGAALEALRSYGAKYGIGFGMMGSSFAIPTKDRQIQTLSLQKIDEYVDKFKHAAENNQHLTFWVTAIGCGLAGYRNCDIAPLFIGSSENCNFPDIWKDYLE